MHADTDPALAAWRDIHAQIGEVISHSAQVEFQMRMLFETLINGTGPVLGVSSHWPSSRDAGSQNR